MPWRKPLTILVLCAAPRCHAVRRTLHLPITPRFAAVFPDSLGLVTPIPLLAGPLTLCHRKPSAPRKRAAPEGQYGGRRSHARQARPDHGASRTTARSPGASPRRARAHGAELAFTYQGDALKKRVEPLAEEVGGLVVGHCDVTDEASLDAVFAAVKKAWGTLDFVLHAIAFSDKDQLVGRYVETTTPRISPRRWRSPATRSPRSRSAPRS